MRTIKSFNEMMWVLLIYFAMCVTAHVANAQAKDEKEWVKGGVYVGRSLSGGCVSIPFVKVGDAENDRDDDREQILGYNPLNIQTNSKGDIIWQRVYADDFAPLNHPYKNRPCKCPPYNE